MNSNINIREITKSDLPSLFALFKEFTVFEKRPEALKNSIERMEKEQDLLKGFVVENDAKQLVGYVTWYPAYHTWTGKALHLDDLYLQPDYRGIGLGTKLIQKVIDLAKEQNCYKVKWQVSHWNESAKAFYRGLGAEISNIEESCDLIIE
ncbi:GNAT family N-acetyltransferase [Jiulongibacter sediminis]|uniref:GNAT family N-acetyltransferase n=1 Tax=Jiulongibacter sediminis TaxID=1605367 RepID=UPI0026F229DD|nr:GNAT family N-acetyltransferase [Jiulongibacter sediminis]